MRRRRFLAGILSLALAASAPLGATSLAQAQPLPSADPLPSWRESPRKRALLTFIEQSSSGGTALPPEERIAVFDHDGTLWSEKPLYFPMLYAIDRVQRLAPAHPTWHRQEPFASALRGDLAALLLQGNQALIPLLEASVAGMSPEDFRADVRAWLGRARQPGSGRPLAGLVFQPMLELLRHLRQRGFRTYIVTGGDAMFLRAWSEAIYGIPPEQVIGTRLQLAYREDDPGGPRLERRPVLEQLVDGPAKPIVIEQTLGRRPLAAFGNSDGDRAMLAWTMAGSGPRLALLVHHTDGRREWAYDRDSPVGRLDRALDQARREGWLVLDMARDWAVVHPTGTSSLTP
jgi:phosphoglycolate phosphatase-like HAD superfamily hydrolase